MPDKNEILISAKFDIESLKKDIQILAKTLREQIKNQFAGSKINISSAFQPVKITLDLTYAKEQIQKWQDGLRVVIPVAPVVASTKDAPKYSSTKRTDSTADIPVDLSKQLKLADSLTVSYSELDKVIKGLRVADPIFTKNLSEVASIRKQLRDLGNKDATELTDKDVKKYEVLSKSLGRLGDEFNTTKEKIEASAPEIEKNIKQVDAAVKDSALLGGRALTFQLGVVGFGLQTLGRQFTQLAQSIANFANNTSKAIEPLERIRNLVSQDSSNSSKEKSLILKTIDKIADMPGSNLDGALKAFRSINSVGLQTAETLQLIEGLTKATARAGTGGEGLERIANQIRQFKTSGVFTAQDVRPIIEQGGRDITEIFSKKFGSVDAEVLAKAGADKVIQALIEGLQDVEAPLLTTSDRVNRLTNSFTRMRAVIGEIVSPGLDAFLSLLKNDIEPLVNSIAEKFRGLSKSTKTLIGEFLIAVPAILGLSGALLSFLGIISLSFAILGRVAQLMGAFARTAGLVGAEVTGLAVISGSFGAIFTKISTFVAGGVESILSFVTAIRFLYGTGVLTLTKFFSIFTEGAISILGLTNPIGIAINLLLAYATNLGNFRDSVNEGISSIINSFSKLFTVFSKLSETEGFKALIGTLGVIFDAISGIISLIAGTVGFLLEGLLASVAQFVDIFTTFFDIFNSDSLSTFATKLYNFVTSIVKFIIGIFFNGINLIIAYLLDKVGDAFSSLSTTISENIKKQAKELRESVIPATQVANEFSKIKTSSTQSADALKTFNSKLKEANTLTQGLREEFDNIALSLAKAQSSIEQQNARAAVSQANSKRDIALEKAIRENPRGALPSVDNLLNENLKANLNLVNNAGADAIKQAGISLSTKLKQLQNFALPEGLNTVFGTQFDFEARLARLADNAKRGSINLKQMKAEIAEINRLGNELADKIDKTQVLEEETKNPTDTPTSNGSIFMPTPLIKDSLGIPKVIAKDKKQVESFKTVIADYSKVVKDVNSSVIDVVKEGENKESEINRVTNEAIAERIRRVEEIAKAIRELDAIARTTPLKKTLEDLNSVIATQEEGLKSAQDRGDNERVLQLLDSINKKKRERINLEERISREGQAEKSAINEANIAQQKELSTQKQTNDELKTRIDLMTQLIEVNKQAYVKGLSDITKYENDIRALLTRSDSMLPRTLDKRTQQGRDLVRETFNENSKILFPSGTDNSSALDIRNSIINAEKKKATSGDVNIRTTRLLDNIVKIAPIGKTFDEFKKNLDELISSSNFSDTANTFQKEITGTFKLLNNEIELSNKRLEAFKRQVEDNPNDKDAKQNFEDELAIQQRLTEEATLLTPIQDFINKLVIARTSELDKQLAITKRTFEFTIGQLEAKKELLDLEQQLGDLLLNKLNNKLNNPKNIKDTLVDPKLITELENEQSQRRIELIENEYASRVAAIKEERAIKKEALIADGKDEESIKTLLSYYDIKLSLLKDIRDVELNNEEEDNAARGLDNLTQSLSKFYEFAKSGQGVVSSFEKLIFGMTGRLGKNFKVMSGIIEIGANLAATAITGLFDSIAEGLANGENPLKSFKKFMGDLLISVGTSLIKLGAAALAMGIIRAVLFLDFKALAEGAKAAAIAIPIGVGLIVAGRALGGGGAATTESNINAANSANKDAGASTQATYDPDKDPKLIYQKALLTQVVIDIRHDDGMIVKKVIKAVNRDSRLANLIGNDRIGFII
jgi:hypothetical protein